MKMAKKLSIINVHEYPRNNYKVYWEYGIVQSVKGVFDWWARFIAYDTGDVVAESSGIGFETENKARESAQIWVAQNIVSYKREAPLEEITDVMAQALVREFDDNRKIVMDDKRDPRDKAKAFANIDKIRGLLKANGIVLNEGQSIGYDGDTVWSRVGG